MTSVPTVYPVAAVGVAELSAFVMKISARRLPPDTVIAGSCGFAAVERAVAASSSYGLPVVTQPLTVYARPAQQVSVPVSQLAGRVIVTVVPSDDADVALAHQNACSVSIGLPDVTAGVYLVQGDASDCVFVPVVVFGIQPTVVITTMSFAAYVGSVIARSPVVTAAIAPC